MSKVRMLDLFSGIGGFSLAAEWCWGKELEIVGFVEIDSFCQKVLERHYPKVPIYSNITNYECGNLDDISLITSGFPCQDISIAGKGAGIEGERSGLWSEFKRIISEVRPRFALIENVPALTFRGLDVVLSDLAKIGYDAEWQCISASEVGAWHKRERIWIVAYPDGKDAQGSINKSRGNGKPIGTMVIPETWKTSEILLPKSALCRTIDGIRDRVHRTESLGNAIVPQVAYIIMQQIKNIMEA